jgi:hypothetical protein
MERMARIATGEKIWSGSKDPLHKAEWRVPTIEQQQRALEWIGDKVLPALQATEVTGAEGKDLFPGPADFDAAGLARALFDVGKEAYVREISEKGMVVVDAAALPLTQRLLDARQSSPEAHGHGKESESQKISDPTPTPPYGDACQSDGAPRSPNRDEIERQYEVGECEAFELGVYIQCIEDYPGSTAIKWEIRDSTDHRHAIKRSHTDAVAKAKELVEHLRAGQGA